MHSYVLVVWVAPAPGLAGALVRLDDEVPRFLVVLPGVLAHGTLTVQYRPSEQPAVTTTLGNVRDPAGREVVLDAEGWQHILDNHREMARYQDAVLDTVQGADVRRPDPRLGRERLYRYGVGPSIWCFVVVDYNQEPARVVTAFGSRRNP